MAHMTLPAEHSEADALLAERIGRALDLDEVHVFWTLPVDEPATAGGPVPERDDLLAPAGLLGALAGLAILVGRAGVRLIAARA